MKIDIAAAKAWADCGKAGAVTAKAVTDCGKAGTDTTKAEADCGKAGTDTAKVKTDCGKVGAVTTKAETVTAKAEADCGKAGTDTTKAETTCGKVKAVTKKVDLVARKAVDITIKFLLEPTRMRRIPDTRNWDVSNLTGAMRYLQPTACSLPIYSGIKSRKVFKMESPGTVLQIGTPRSGAAWGGKNELSRAINSRPVTLTFYFFKLITRY